jgi:small subunit ribosomal protein S16
MVKLRLRRKGRAHHPVYDVVAIDSRKKRDGVFIERLGYYDPHTRPSTFKLDSDRAIYWLNVGAQCTNLVRNILSYEGILLRRQMQFKGKTEQEIEEAIKIHKEVAKARYSRRKEIRKKKELAKEKAEAEAKAAGEAPTA